MPKPYLVLLTLVLFTCSKDPVIPVPEHTYFKNSYSGYSDSIIRIVTYNIQLGFTSDQDPFNEKNIGASAEQIHDIATIIRQVDPNIVLLQEVPKNKCNTIVKNFIESLADSLKMNYAFGAYGDVSDKCDGTWGVATLSKFRINAIENVMVRAVNKYSVRSVLRTEVQNGNKAFNTYNLHHDGRDTLEIRNTMDFVKKSSLPVIIGGDFNRGYDNPTLVIPGLEDYFSFYLKVVDRIYGNLDAYSVGIGFIYNSNKVSDHYAMFVKLKMN